MVRALEDDITIANAADVRALRSRGWASFMRARDAGGDHAHLRCDPRFVRLHNGGPHHHHIACGRGALGEASSLSFPPTLMPRRWKDLRARLGENETTRTRRAYAQSAVRREWVMDN